MIAQLLVKISLTEEKMSVRKFSYKPFLTTLGLANSSLLSCMVFNVSHFLNFIQSKIRFRKFPYLNVKILYLLINNDERKEIVDSRPNPKSNLSIKGKPLC